MIHAPKHSWSDTMIVFGEVIITGDWELNTIRSVHDGKIDAVPLAIKMKSIDKMAAFEEKFNWKITTVFSTHANDRRENVNFTELMNDTKHDRKFW